MIAARPAPAGRSPTLRFVRADAVGNARHYRINERCVACFPSAADVVMGRPAPTTTGGCE